MDIARSALITITTYCGALLIPLLAPSNRTDAAQGGAERGHDRRPTLLAVAMVVLFGAILALPAARWFYEIEPIPLADAAVLAFISLAWALVVFAARRLAVADRLEKAARSHASLLRARRASSKPAGSDGPGSSAGGRGG